MKSNPYLTVKVVSQNMTSQRCYVQIWHPDVFHYNETILSNKTLSIITSFSSDSINKDEKLRQKLNRMINEDAFVQLLTKMYGTRSGAKGGNLCQNIASISAFTDLEPSKWVCNITRLIICQRIHRTSNWHLCRLWCWRGMSEVANFSLSAYVDIILPGMELFLENGGLSDDLIATFAEGYYNVIFKATGSTILGISEKKSPCRESNPELICDRWQTARQRLDQGYTYMWDTMTEANRAFGKASCRILVEACPMVMEKQWVPILDRYCIRWELWYRCKIAVKKIIRLKFFYF